MLRAGRAEVVAVVDAETLLLKQPAVDGQPEFVGEVRLLGIAVSESLRTGQSIAFLKKLTESGIANVELDKRRVDHDGRLLAYVYAGDLHLSEELVAAGWARVHTYPGDSMSVNRKLLAAQASAKRQRLGIWSE
jgi:endonuclease YncB( thermonuclease family)